MADRWTCAVCGKVWVVPSLARICEAKCGGKT
jgi:hypothetical protein